MGEHGERELSGLVRDMIDRAREQPEDVGAVRFGACLRFSLSQCTLPLFTRSIFGWELVLANHMAVLKRHGALLGQTLSQLSAGARSSDVKLDLGGCDERSNASVNPTTMCCFTVSDEGELNCLVLRHELDVGTDTLSDVTAVAILIHTLARVLGVVPGELVMCVGTVRLPYSKIMAAKQRLLASNHLQMAFPKLLVSFAANRQLSSFVAGDFELVWSDK